jgi:hypothetical protein
VAQTQWTRILSDSLGLALRCYLLYTGWCFRGCRGGLRPRLPAFLAVTPLIRLFLCRRAACWAYNLAGVNTPRGLVHLPSAARAARHTPSPFLLTGSLARAHAGRGPFGWRPRASGVFPRTLHCRGQRRPAVVKQTRALLLRTLGPEAPGGAVIEHGEFQQYVGPA